MRPAVDRRETGVAMARVPARLREWTDPALSPDGKSVWLKIKTEDGESTDIELPLDQLGDTVAFFTSIANHVVEQKQDQGETPPRMMTHSWAPIPVVGIGLATGRSHEETMLVVQLAGFDLAFSLDGSKLAALGRDFAGTAQTLSAGGKPQ